MEKDHEQPFYVAIDTNIWRQTLMLRTGMGLSLLYLIRCSGGKIILPEVIEREIEKNLLKAGNEACEEISKGLRTIKAIIGHTQRFEPPSKEIIRDAIQKGLENLSQLIIRDEITIEHTRSALERVNSESPPNGSKNQQFKDSLIWESILRFSQNKTTYFLTDDGGFFKDKGKNIIAENLSEDCKKFGSKIFIYSKIEDLLSRLTAEVPEKIDNDHITKIITNEISNKVNEAISNKSIRIGQTIDSEISAYLTGSHNLLSISFKIQYECIYNSDYDANRTQSIDGVLAAGTCTFNDSEGVLSNMNMDSIEVFFTDEDGKKGTSRHQYLHFNLHPIPIVLHEVKVDVNSIGKEQP